MTGVMTPSGHLWRARYPIRVQSAAQTLGQGHLWPRCRRTASFARALPPTRRGLSRASLLGPGQNDFGRIDISTVKDALRPVHWQVYHCPFAMQLEKPAAVDGP